MDTIQVVPDPKKEIQFWLDALSNPNVNRENKELLNECLKYQLNAYLLPVHSIVVKK
jgi:hypothetical protein